MSLLLMGFGFWGVVGGEEGGQIKGACERVSGSVLFLTLRSGRSDYTHLIGKPFCRFALSLGLLIFLNASDN